MTEENVGGVVDEGEGTDGSNEPADTGETDKIAALEQEIAQLKAAQTASAEPEDVFEPSALFTDEELDRIDDEQKPLYKALNQMHIDRQTDKHEYEKRIAELESGSEAAGQERSIDSYIESNSKLSGNPALAKTFKDRINTVMKGDGVALLEALAYQVISQAKGKPDTSGSTSKPRSVAGAVRKDVAPKKYTNTEQAMADAKKAILSKGT